MSTLRDAMSHAALGWVKPELDETLRQVRSEVEYFVEEPADTSHMRFCAGYLHQVQGTLRMVELLAPALVAEELELLARALQEGAVAERDEACATLMRGAVLLPDYLERLQNGHRDIPIVLLPLLNEIRAARGAGALDERVLLEFNPDAVNASADEIEHARGSLSGRNRDLLNTVGGAVKEELLRIKDALDLHMRTGGAPQDLYAQIEDLGRVAETLGMLGLGASREVIARQRDALRQVVEQGQNVDNQLLLEVAGALLYVDSSLDQQVAHLGAQAESHRDSAAAESRRTLEVLAQEAIGNFAAAREAFVAFIETNWDHERLYEVPKLLQDVAGALRILELPEPAGYLGAVCQYVEVELIGRRRIPGGRTLDTLADALASLEYYLEALRDRRAGSGEILDITRSSLEALHYWPLPEPAVAVEPRDDAAVAPATAAPLIPTVVDTAAGLTPAVDDAAPAPAAVPPTLPPLVFEAALAPLPQSPAASFPIDPVAAAPIAPPSSTVDPLSTEAAAPSADAGAPAWSWDSGAGIASAPLDTDSAAVDGAADAQEALPAQLPAVSWDEPAAEPMPAAPAQDLRADEPDSSEIAQFMAQLQAAADSFDPVAPVTATHLAAMPAEPAPAPSADAHDPLADVGPALAAALDEPAMIAAGFDAQGEEIDQEIRDVFIEEFDEELENLANLLPVWKLAPDNLERLRPVRRVFHTLKGSGRLVGARVLGEFAWKIESMLNRVLDGSRPASPAVVTLVEQAVAMLPQFNQALRGNGLVSAEVLALQDVADRVAAGEDVFHTPAAAVTPTVADIPVLADDAAPQAEFADGTPATIDDVLREILEAEVAQHLQTVREWLDASRVQPQPADEALLRAVHTMSGAFAMTDVPEITAVTSPAETFIKRSLAAAITPSGEGVDAIAALVGAIETTVRALRAPEPRIPPFTALAQRLQALVDSLPEGQWPPVAEMAALDEDGIDPSLLQALPEADVSAGQVGWADEPVEDTAAVDSDALSPSDAAVDATPADAEAPSDLPSWAIVDAAAPEPMPWTNDGSVQDVIADATTDADASNEVLPEEVAFATEADAAVAADAPVDVFAWTEEGAEVPAAAIDAAAAEAVAMTGDAEGDTLHSTASDAADVAGDLHHVWEAGDGLEEAGIAGIEADALVASDAVADEAPHADAATPAVDADAGAESGTPADAPVFNDASALAAIAAAASLLAASGDADKAAELIDSATSTPAGDDLAADEPVALGDDAEVGAEAEIEVEVVDDAPVELIPDVTADATPADIADAAENAVPSAEAEPASADAADTDDAADTAIDVDADSVAQATAAPVADAEADKPAPAPITLAPISAPLPEDARVAAEPSLPSSPIDAGALDFRDLDRELVDIFVEEGKDLLDQCDELLARLREVPDDREALVGLQRELHTLKGGARMAGINAIGDLGHSIESLLEAVAGNRTELERGDVQLLERGFDHLHQLLTHTQAHRAVVMPHALIAAFDGRTRGTPAGAADEAAAPAPVVAIPVSDALSAPVAEEAVAEDGGQRSAEQVRVRADLLDRLVNHAGEVAIYRSRLEQQLGAFRNAMAELDRTNARLRDQLRRLDLETEAQIVARYRREQDQGDQAFDPLELDRFSTLQQLSRALNESAADLGGLQGVLDELARNYDVLLHQQSRVSSELQDGLMRARMVPFDGVVPRLRRVVRQAAQDTGKQVHLSVEGTHGELDRNVLDRMIAPLEHMLRNSVAHGVETPEERARRGKAEEGQIALRLRREGSEIVLEVADDGAGLNREAIRQRALQRGLVQADSQLSERELDNLIFASGFSTSEQVSQLAGRGVGMDVVRNEVSQLGGSVDIHSVDGKGVTFVLRLPQTLAVTQAVFVQIGETTYAVPVGSVSGIGRIARERYEAGNDSYHYNGESYALHDLGTLVGQGPAKAEGAAQVPLLLVRSGELRAAVAIDQVLGNREIVVKPVGLQIASVPGIYGATITGEGNVVVILDVAPLVRRHLAQPDRAPAQLAPAAQRHVPLVMVVDDSLTMRKVTGRVLERHNFEVVVARDGVEALERLEERVPDLMLLDIEMPRMDGYELATAMRADPRFKDVPIVMITSRSGDKHRQRAFEIGVQRYLGKPYQELDLMRNVYDLLGIARVRE